MAAESKCHHLVIVGAVIIVLTTLQWSRIQIYTDDGTLLLHTKHSKLQQIPVCSSDERLDYLQNKCDGNTGQIQNLTLKEQRNSYAHIFVDEKHKIVACLPPKSGCTTWKAIMANNSQDKPLPPNFNTKRLHTEFLDKFGIFRLSRYNSSMQQYFLESEKFFKIMIARHPFERLYSGYVNKLVSGQDPPNMKLHGGRILKIFHPELDEETRKAGFGATFYEFVQYLKLPISSDPHWDPVYNICLPCHIHYDQIVKTETMDEDNVDIIMKRLGPYRRGIGTTSNTAAGGRQLSSLTKQGRKLEAFSTLNMTDLKFLEQRFLYDLEYFGYSWSVRNNGNTSVVSSSCVSGSEKHMCC